MNLIDIYTMHTSGSMTDEDAAKALGVSVPGFRIRASKWGHRLPLLLATLDKIKAGTISRDEASEVLEVTPRQVNVLMNTWGVQRPVHQKRLQHERASIKWSVRKKYALDFIAERLSLDAAAESADVSVRQIRRWVSDLLRKHYDMPFKDLSRITTHRRRQLAEDIQKSEDLEEAKQHMMKAVLTGEKSVSEAAIERVAMKQAQKLANNVRRRPKIIDRRA